MKRSELIQDFHVSAPPGPSAGKLPLPSKEDPAGERGVALLLVLAMLVFMTAYIVQFNYEARVKYIQAANGRDQARAYYLAKSGVQIYVLLLSFGRQVTSDEMTRSFLEGFGMDPDNALWQSIPFIDTALLRAVVGGGSQGGASGAEEAVARGGEDGSEEGPSTLLTPDEIEASRDAGGSGMVKGFLDFDGDFKAEVEDEDRRINLNLMADLANGGNALDENPIALALYGLMAPKQYDKMFTDELKMDRWELIGNVLDWVDADTQRSAGLGGYEDSLYDSQQRFPYTTKNARFDTVAETQLVAGVNDKVYSLFSPQWTVFGSGKININTADPAVLWGLVKAFADSAVTDEMVTQAVQQAVTQRQLVGFRSTSDFTSIVSAILPLKENGSTLKNAISTSSKTFTLRSTGYVGDATATVVTTLTYSSGAKYKLDYWKEE